MSTSIATLRVWRGADRGSGTLIDYLVPHQDGQSVLDALLWIRANQDASLAIRHACHNGNVCKECSVLIDGKATFACTTKLGTSPIVVEPLAGKRLIRDLVTDTVPPTERLTAPDQTG